MDNKLLGSNQIKKDVQKTKHDFFLNLFSHELIFALYLTL